jgi:hypothetical protein
MHDVLLWAVEQVLLRDGWLEVDSLLALNATCSDLHFIVGVHVRRLGRLVQLSARLKRSPVIRHSEEISVFRWRQILQAWMPRTAVEWAVYYAALHNGAARQSEWGHKICNGCTEWTFGYCPTTALVVKLPHAGGRVSWDPLAVVTIFTPFSTWATRAHTIPPLPHVSNGLLQAALHAVPVGVDQPQREALYRLLRF